MSCRRVGLLGSSKIVRHAELVQRNRSPFLYFFVLRESEKISNFQIPIFKQ